ncbi:hypothetical protein F5X68DRAFT_237567 [Plectosphaerella plurivora]|uniref:Uncharacterized protein n=1 Tax=Plectosphaerella plurivora TaxID=936078 RepID=A0A9P9A552_9PEZI|nr:hypothetical protein F5X68DRAFT_237567 [Plectosphaerella plurivora]
MPNFHSLMTFLAVITLAGIVSGTATPLLRRDDDSFLFRFSALGVEKSGDPIYVSGILPNGATFEAGEALKPSVGVSASVSFDSPEFKLMIDAIGIDVQQDLQVTPDESFSLTIDCLERQEGSVMWKPLFNYYEGRFIESGESGDLWVPLNTSRSDFDYDCLG